MSSIYSSRRSSLSDPVPPALPDLSTLPVHSKSVPETPAKPLHPPVFRTAPDSPQHNRLLSDDHGLDIEILTHKLQFYQLELEEAELRLKHKRTVEDKQAAEVAAAARFRHELEKLEHSHQATDMEDKRLRSRSTSSHGSLPIGLSSKPNRTRRPEPLLLPDINVEPQEVQSAALPVRSNRSSNMNASELKKHWRRTTISAGRNSSSKIILLSSSGKPEYCDLSIPPVPQLSASASVSTATSPPSMSPMTPLYSEPTEDQIRRELETFALEEGPNIQLSRRSSAVSRRRMPAAFIPDPEDRMPPNLPQQPTPPPAPETPSAFVEVLDFSVADNSNPHSLNRKKSFFSRFERKNDVDALLDLYMTDEQLHEAKVERKKATRSRRQTFFRRWQSTDVLFHKAERPG